VTERWLPIPGYEGYYDVSDLGRVRSLDRVVLQGGRPRRVNGRDLRQYVDGERRHWVNLTRAGRGSSQKVSRLVLLAFVGPAPAGMICCHSDDDPHNNRLTNLRWDTHSANRFDAVKNAKDYWSRRSACENGHEYTEANTAYWGRSGSRGVRTCRECERTRPSKNRARNLKHGWSVAK
jgi:hypothetical protein